MHPGTQKTCGPYVYLNIVGVAGHAHFPDSAKAIPRTEDLDVATIGMLGMVFGVFRHEKSIPSISFVLYGS